MAKIVAKLNEAYLQKELPNLSSVLRTVFLAEPIFKIGSRFPEPV